MRLVRNEQDMLEGKECPAKQKAMELLVKYADGLGAESFVDTNNATIIVGSIPDIRIVERWSPPWTAMKSHPGFSSTAMRGSCWIKRGPLRRRMPPSGTRGENMHELYLEKPGDLRMRECRPVSAPKDSEVKVKVIYGGICGSDLRALRGTIPHAVYPCRSGHEILGTVVEAGEKSRYSVGTKVVSFPNTYCGRCEFCLQGKTNICLNKKVFGITVDGLFAQEIILDSEFVVPIPPDLADEKAILVEPFAVNVHALQRTNIPTEKSVAVIGCGTEGLLATALLNHRGVDLTVLDVNPLKMEKARSLNMKIKALHPSEVRGQVFDVVVEAAGVKASIEQAFQLVKPGGGMIALGVTGEEVIYPALRITRSEITIYGTIIYTKKDFADAIALLQDPAFNVEPILSRIDPFTKYQEAFADALTGNFAKIVLDFRQT